MFFLTKEVLYLLSHSSIFTVFITLFYRFVSAESQKCKISLFRCLFVPFSSVMYILTKEVRSLA